MGFPGRLLEGILRHSRRQKYRYYDGRHSPYYNEPSFRAGSAKHPAPLPFLGSLLQKGKKLLFLLIIASGLILLVFVLLLVILAPLIVQGIDYLYHNGLKGILDAVLSMLGRLWEGAGK